MKATKRGWLARLLVVALAVASLTAFGLAASKPKLNKTKLTLIKGQTYTLKIEKATKNQIKKASWKTKSKKIATV